MKGENDVIQIDCMSEDVVLIITACIQPNQNQRYLALKDIKERLRQYIACIEFYIAHSPFYHIVFCDNSNYLIEETPEFGIRVDFPILSRINRVVRLFNY